MRVVITSDTHGRHRELGTLSGDVLIHCGDFSDGFNPKEEDVASVDQWFGEQRFDQVICVGGNHDFFAQHLYDMGSQVFQNAVYLVDDVFQFGGVNFYGSPWLPELIGWAHYRPNEELRGVWTNIPADTDVLVTHTPPLGILDKTRSGRSVGCSHLRAALEDMSLRVHCFGHVHASRGHSEISGVTYLNATAVNSDYEVQFPPIELDL